MAQEFFDIHEQTEYSITISRPENPEDLSDFFITIDEMRELIGDSYHGYYGPGKRTIYLNARISAACVKWAEKLEASGRKTLRIDDEELLEILKKGHFSSYMPGHTDKYGRHGDRISYARRYKRVKKKPTKGDVRDLWWCLQYGFRDKYGCYPSHIPTYDRHLTMFKAYKKIVGWRAVRRNIGNKDSVKFIRQIWDNPEEFI